LKRSFEERIPAALRTKAGLARLSDLLHEIVEVDHCIPQRALERKPVHFIVKRENDPAAIRMLHLNVATLAMNFHETHPLQGGKNLFARK
jgi:hypothetical protein